VLAEFLSVVGAVECGVAVQQKLADANVGVPADNAIRFRIGIHVGDVATRGGDLLGDSVNVAARVQALAEPGTVWVSEDAYRHVAGKIDQSFEDKGERQVKNIARPLRVYAVVPPASRPKGDKLADPGKPSVAVLPFTNMSDDKDTDYFADGVVEDIITGGRTFPGCS
jgi:adenylate cyclase